MTWSCSCIPTVIGTSTVFDNLIIFFLRPGCSRNEGGYASQEHCARLDSLLSTRRLSALSAFMSLRSNLFKLCL